jgi:hypothetical protein
MADFAKELEQIRKIEAREALPSIGYRIVTQQGPIPGPLFARYVDAFNFRANHNLVGARIIEESN